MKSEAKVIQYTDTMTDEEAEKWREDEITRLAAIIKKALVASQQIHSFMPKDSLPSIDLTCVASAMPIVILAMMKDANFKDTLMKKHIFQLMKDSIEWAERARL